MENKTLNNITIDLNADLGEGGADDAAILACVSSANIACGGHAGDTQSMRIAVRAAMACGVAIGAHPSFVDRENFGRTEMHLPMQQVYDEVLEQICALQDICKMEGTQLVHVKPHGALYNQAARDVRLAETLVKAIAAAGPQLKVVGLAGSELIHAARRAGMSVAEEAFADRRYNSDGSLVSRKLSGATIDEVELALQQAMRMVEQQRVISIDSKELQMNIDTLCLHGDGAHALQLARRLREQLQQREVVVTAGL
ncbi:5-oxoprolinase subunit PxpA [Undibacterium sp. SXout11W]|uniref:5-oxoprolinase subunit PxpA n=1 Tax=Undibacterium sp. SXout11W TaxID=3413050 RepID=UPI003BF1A9C3